MVSQENVQKNGQMCHKGRKVRSDFGRNDRRWYNGSLIFAHLKVTIRSRDFDIQIDIYIVIGSETHETKSKVG